VPTDVRVRLCTLTIRRTDGWSWGPGPEPYIQAALAGIETVIEAAITEAQILPGADVRLEDPVQIEIGSDGAVTAASWQALVELLRAHATAPATDVVVRADTDVALRPGDELLAVPPAPDATDVTAGALARILGRWSRAGLTAEIVAAWPPELVRAWIAAIADAVRDGPGAPAAVSMSAEAVTRIAEGVLETGRAERSGREASDRLLILLAAITAALGDRLPDAATQAFARARVLADSELQPTAPARGTALAVIEPAPGRADEGEAAEPTEAAPLPDVVPALPLLVLAQLAAVGYVDAIVAAAAATGLPGAARALGGALAGKVLPPPEQGWSRTPAEAAVVVLASGGHGGADSAALAARQHELAAPLASALQAAYAEGRSRADPVLVWSGDVGIVCGEEEGLLPAAWLAGEHELRPALEALGRPPVRRSAAFAPLARDLHERRAVPGFEAPALERALGAAAGTALGLIAMHLSSPGGPPTPLLALERLADLEGRVTAGPEGLVIAVPRGQRWLDLGRARLLEPFAVPWLPAGRLEVATW
jgi:hypothetical protein